MVSYAGINIGVVLSSNLPCPWRKNQKEFRKRHILPTMNKQKSRENKLTVILFR